MPSRTSHARSGASVQPMTLQRGFVLEAFMAAWLLLLAGRLYHLQIIQYVDLVARGERQQQRTIEIAPTRGTIYDREMQPLAMSLAVDSVFADPSEFPKPEMVADLIGPVLGIEKSDLLAKFKAFKSFCWVKRKVSSEESARLRDLNLKGIYFQKEMKRFYPKGDLAAPVIGYVGLDDNGLGGLEYRFNDSIKGTPGRALIATDARRQSFESSTQEGQRGKNLVLTLDQNIQFIAEKAIAEAAAKWHMAGGTVIVQQPNTGEILAMASYPTFDPNNFGQSTGESRKNRAVSQVYEPGSTFKLVTVAAALEEEITSPKEVIDCQRGSIVLAGHVIHDDHPHGSLTVSQVMAQSSGVGVIKLGLRLGEDRFYRYVKAFGFGDETGIELPAEERGLLRPPSRWSGISLGEMSTGQEVGVTPLQIISACSAIANGGVLMKPRVVREIFEGDRHQPIIAVPGRRVVSARTSELMKEILTEAVEAGTGSTAKLNGFTAAGKTGTAQKIDSSGSYSKTHYIPSFVGFAPVSKPAVTILVVIDSPVGAIYGREVAAPVFRSIAEQTLGYLNVPQDNPSKYLQVASSSPAGSPRQQRGDRVDFQPFRPEPPVAATSPVQPVSFSKPVTSDAGGTLMLDDGPMVVMPDFTGMALRQVAQQCQELGLDLSMRGSGLAFEQSPPPRSQVPAGSKVWVIFGR
ncbi:MAG: transpeptidase family protein [Acidobacteria bacterium]|nr:transpeptidase family protein [Acidobacteriota bacterium]